jgi:hypothetical protein
MHMRLTHTDDIDLALKREIQKLSAASLFLLAAAGTVKQMCIYRDA